MTNNNAMFPLHNVSHEEAFVRHSVNLCMNLLTPEISAVVTTFNSMTSVFGALSGANEIIIKQKLQANPLIHNRNDALEYCREDFEYSQAYDFENLFIVLGTPNIPQVAGALLMGGVSSVGTHLDYHACVNVANEYEA